MANILQSETQRSLRERALNSVEGLSSNSHPGMQRLFPLADLKVRDLPPELIELHKKADQLMDQMRRVLVLTPNGLIDEPMPERGQFGWIE